MAEKILMNYGHNITYNNTPTNVIGATTNLTLRTVTAHTDANSKYVRMFGVLYSITAVTAIEDPVDVNMTFKVYALDGTLLGSRVGGGAFVAGSTVTAQGCYLKIEASGGAVTVLAGIDITSTRSAVPDALTFVCPVETVADGSSLTLYLSDTSSTYYDAGLMYGGDRHTPTGISRLPYIDPVEAVGTLGGAFTICTVLDSATYLIDDEIDLNVASMSFQAALGQTPTLIRTIGATEYFNPEIIIGITANNVNSIFFNENGNDANSGTWHSPKLTIQIPGNTNLVYGGSGATNSNSVFDIPTTINSALTGKNYFTEYGYSLNVTSTITPLFTIKGFGFYNFLFKDITGLVFSKSTVTGETQTIKYCRFFTVHEVFHDYINSSAAITTINNCLVTSTGTSDIIFITPGSDYDLTCKNNNFTDGDKSIFVEDSASGIDLSIIIEGNVFYNNIGVWEKSINLVNFTLKVKNNIFYKGRYQLRLNNTVISGALVSELNDNIFTGYTPNAPDAAVYNAGSYAWTIDYNCFYDNSVDETGLITNNNPVNDDPLFCEGITSSFFGISAFSPCKRAGISSDDIGIKLRIMQANESSIIINGIIFDNDLIYNTSVYLFKDHTDLTITWCDCINSSGQSIDIYDDSTSTDCIIEYNKIYNNQEGISLLRDGNTIKNNLIYYNKLNGIALAYLGNEVNHNVIYLNNINGINLDSGVTATIKNNIIHNNSILGIKAILPIVITYCCITDGTSTVVDKTSSTNISDNPLLVNTNIGSENFNIKTIKAGYLRDSPCKDVADDDEDIGAYSLSRSINTDAWKKYELAFNPQVKWQNQAKGYLKFESVQGDKDTFAKAFKRIFILEFKSPQVSSEQQRKKLEYLATILKTRENEIVDDEKIKIRLKFQPTSYLESGTLATIDATALTLVDVSKSWDENEWKGFHVGIVFDNGTNMVIESIGKTGSIAGGWTVDEWIGYYVPINGYYYRVISNTAQVLTFSDPDETLVSGLVVWSIEKYFKMSSNTLNQICILDPDSELVDGSYNYYIDFIECKVHTPRFSYGMPRFKYTNEKAKTGHSITLEEI